MKYLHTYEIFESVIDPNYTFIKQELFKLKDDIFNYAKNYKQLLNILNRNKIFENNSIIFSDDVGHENSIYEGYGISSAATIPETGVIYVIFDNTIMSVIKKMKSGELDYSVFIGYLENIIAHELVHREQLVRMGQKGIDSLIKKIDNMHSIESEEESGKVYFNMPTELMAFAKQSMLELIMNGINKEKILEDLKTNSGLANLLNNSDSFLQLYYFYKKDSKQFHRFTKYLYEYVIEN